MTPQHRLAIEIMSECGKSPRDILVDINWGEDGPTMAEIKNIVSRPRHGRRAVNNFITHNGETRIITEWAEITGIARKTIQKRLQLGWSVKDALTIEVQTSRRGA